ncbi:PilZ domain-containing protein [Sphingomonas sp. KR1UV-12]|uniref:PilZ domain-containing protein n=1 Tax=Sphingomonas aurea TaxID=3063994 RepID=A0ABT9EGT5_9SPHN|nr:PilZ domain-containing protein [Sphingomonas sp. KR1UV-12]MDP1026185.1 PilZ domain-containing protein [Sphingomonas sp. KR1UV-12]
MFVAEFEPFHPKGRRASPRAALTIDASLDRGRLGRAVCRVIDLSTTGARLQTYSALSRGSMICLILPELGKVEAEIMWSNDFLAGCQFRRPILQTLVDRLAGDDD